MIVADANLIAYLLLPGERTAEAEAVYVADPEWVVPTLCLSELRSVVLKYVRARLLTLADAQRAITRAEVLVEGRVVDVPSRRVLELANAGGCSAYDAEYVALAEELGVALITTDQRVLKAFPKVAVSPTRFLQG